MARRSDPRPNYSPLSFLAPRPWRFTLAVRRLEKQIAGDVKLRLPPWQSRGDSFARLEYDRLPGAATADWSTLLSYNTVVAQGKLPGTTAQQKLPIRRA